MGLVLSLGSGQSLHKHTKPSTVGMEQVVHGEESVGRQGRRTANTSKEILLPTVPSY